MCSYSIPLTILKTSMYTQVLDELGVSAAEGLEEAPSKATQQATAAEAKPGKNYEGSEL